MYKIGCDNVGDITYTYNVNRKHNIITPELAGIINETLQEHNLFAVIGLSKWTQS